MRKSDYDQENDQNEDQDCGPPITLAGIFNGLQCAVNSAQEMLRSQQLQVLDGYFETNGKALTKEIKTIHGETLKVPLVSLIRHNALLLDEVEISFSANVDETEMCLMSGSANGTGVDAVNYNVSFSPTKKENQMLVKVKFKASQPTEGFSRTVDEFDKSIGTNDRSQ